MAPIQNTAVVFLEVSTGFPELGKHFKYVKDRKIDLNNLDIQGGIVTKNLVVSLDPFVLRRMKLGGYELNQPLMGFVVGKVIKSDNKKFQVGRYVDGMAAFEEYTAFPKAKTDHLRILSDEELKLGLALTVWVRAAGMPGLTAYNGFYDMVEPKKGETIFITGASGAVGQIVGQLAKRENLKVIGSAGSDDKVQWLKKELNFDHAFNYKTADVKAELAKFDPLNIYFDNVGGDQLEAALDTAANHARFVECGMMSQYVKPDSHGIRNLMLIVVKRIKMQGFISSDKLQDPSFAPEFYANVPKWIASGELKVKEDVTKGLEKAAEALVGMFEGKNFGKAVVQIADE